MWTAEGKATATGVLERGRASGREKYIYVDGWRTVRVSGAGQSMSFE